jgi:hypothetical protein
MDALSAGPGSSLSDSLWNGVESDASGAPSITIPSTHPDTNSSQQKHLQTDIKTIDTYWPARRPRKASATPSNAFVRQLKDASQRGQLQTR